MVSHAQKVETCVHEGYVSQSIVQSYPMNERTSSDRAGLGGTGPAPAPNCLTPRYAVEEALSVLWLKLLVTLSPSTPLPLPNTSSMLLQRT